MQRFGRIAPQFGMRVGYPDSALDVYLGGRMPTRKPHGGARTGPVSGDAQIQVA